MRFQSSSFPRRDSGIVLVFRGNVGGYKRGVSRQWTGVHLPCLSLSSSLDIRLSAAQIEIDPPVPFREMERRRKLLAGGKEEKLEAF